jgi:hypothetical protein
MLGAPPDSQVARRASLPRQRRQRLLDAATIDAAAASPSGLLVRPDELTWWDWTVLLLHTATEIEHALLAQYLYAAYSLADSKFGGLNVPSDAAKKTKRWRGVIIEIAREEMAHLLTEQNILRLLDAPTSIDRDDFPFQTHLHPFAFELEPLTRSSLAKYVAAEMPASPDPAELSPAELAEIEALANAAAGNRPVNRVGVIFETLQDILADPTRIPDSDLRPNSVDLQAPEDWSLGLPLIVRQIPDRASAVQAVKDIGQEGEGLGTTTPPDISHFARFVTIFREFPANNGVAGPDWIPTRAVPTNPTTSPVPSGESDTDPNRITHPVTLLWVQLSDIRYRMLLTDLGHALHIPGPHDDGNGRTLRGVLQDWTFEEMTTSVRGLASELRTRPRKDNQSASDPEVAAVPFEMPPSMQLPDLEHSFWRLHLSLLDSSQQLIAAIRAIDGPHSLLDTLEAADSTARAFVAAQLAAP